jgi:hypothetical protein
VTYDQGIALLREFGFPVFVAIWFMWRLEKRVDRLFELMTAHMQATALLAKSVDDHVVAARGNGRASALTEGDRS